MQKEEFIKLYFQHLKTNNTDKKFCTENKIPYSSLFYYKRKYNIPTNKRGTNPNSRKKRIYYVNDNAFKTFSLEACYWAGFIASDGNINKNKNILTLGLSCKDESHLSELKKFLQCENPILKYLSKDRFEICSLTITSKEICSDLQNIYNITPKKSLTLKPPKIDDIKYIDAFIVGYIDGDGSIGLYKGKKQKALQIQILGTEKIIDWILFRFKQICNRDINKYKNHINNTWTIMISDKTARKIFNHYFNINVPKLNRKWKKLYHVHCIEYKKYKNLDKYKKIIQLEKTGLNIYDIAKSFNITYQAIYWYKKQPEYAFLKLESDNLDKAIIDIESEN